MTFSTAFANVSKIRWPLLSVGQIFVTLILCTLSDLAAQNISHYPYSLANRRLVMAAPADSVTLALPDSFIIANSDTLRVGKTVLQRGRDYQINYRSAQLYFHHQPAPASDSLILSYRILRISLPRQLAIFKLAKPAKADSALPISNIVTAARQDYLASSRESLGANLSKSGSLTRGVSLGSEQGLKVDSGLRLQLAGKLSDKTEVVAALTDQSTPIQPEGNTQTLNEIDKVFIQLKSERFNATLGDFQIEYGGSEFARYNRKLQGAKIAVGNSETPNSNVQLQFSAAVSRGKFTTNQFNGVEGKQGPYQLQGDRGQIDILILAGTERVWIDGQLMTRGENNDYVIEYSNGQITFTRKRLITSDSRITLDFQFSDERFRRNLYSAQGIATGFNEKLKWQTTLLREGDDQDNPLEFTLNSPERELLAAAGDGLASRDGSRFVGAKNGNYVRRDSIWVYVGPDSGDYEVKFSDLGEGRGDYAYRGFGNFVYVGKNQGRYAPVILLTPAARQEVLDSRLEIAPWRGVSFINEFAISQLDQNLYSSRDDGDNSGRALLSTLRLEPQNSKFGRFSLQARFRKKDSRYRDIDRADVVEFNRRWNLSNEAISTAEEMLESSATYSPITGWNLRGGYGKLNRGSSSGRWEAGLDFKRAKLPELQYQIENIARENANAINSDSKWLRQRGAASYSFLKFKPQLGYEGEDRREIFADTSSGFRFNSYTAGLETKIFRPLKMTTTLNQRDDDARIQRGLAPKSSAFTQSYALALERWKALAADMAFTHRERRFADPQQPEVRTDLADVRVRFAPYQRAIDTDWQYQITNTQTAQQQRVFIKVRAGEGNYRYDADLNEYIPDLFGDYVLRLQPTENFVPVVELRARSNIRINFASLLRSPAPPKKSPEKPPGPQRKSWRDYLKVVTTETFIRLEEKTGDPRVWQIYRLNLSRFQNPQFTQFGAQSLRQDVNLWENNRARALRYRFTALRELNNQYFGEGLSRRQQLRHELRATLALSPRLSSQTELILNREDRTFDAISRRQNRLVLNRTGAVELSYRPRPMWEMAAEAGLAFDEDRAAPAVEVRAYSLKPRSTYSFRGKGRCSGEIEWVQVTATPRGRYLPFELANGNRAGGTRRWNFALEYRVSTNINISASYLGRHETERRQTLHLGKVEMRAFF